MADSMEHERQRWSYMTIRQLTTRLRRITGAQKLGHFIELAYENRQWTLLEAARSKARELGLGWLATRAERLVNARHVASVTADPRVLADIEARSLYIPSINPYSLQDEASQVEEKKKPTVRMIRIGRKK